MVPVVLGEQSPPQPDPWNPNPAAPTPTGLHDRLPNLRLVTDFLDLPAWLALNHPELLERLFIDRSGATMPDGEVLSAAEAAAARLEVTEMRRQVERIRRDLADDPEAAVGQAKDLIETTCKTILGMRGTTGEKLQLPKLVKQTLLHLGVDPTQLAAAGEDSVEAHAAQTLMGGVSKVLLGADELRNARGTGHGRSGGPVVDAALARLTVGAVLPALLYLVELYEHRTDSDSIAPFPVPTSTVAPKLRTSAVVHHASFGEGVIAHIEGWTRRSWRRSTSVDPSAPSVSSFATPDSRLSGDQLGDSRPRPL
jgi:hypothetical protein